MSWRRALDIESIDAIAPVLSEAGADGSRFSAEVNALREQVIAISRAAEDMDVFGVPTFVLSGQIYWGREHLPDIRHFLAAGL